MYCSQLRATAKPFLPTLKQDSCIVVRSLVSLDGKIYLHLDSVSTFSPTLLFRKILFNNLMQSKSKFDVVSFLPKFYLEGEALVPVDPISRQVGLNDIREYFPAADGELHQLIITFILLSLGLHFIQQKADGTQRLVSVCHSFGIVEDQNENICYGDKKFIPPTLGLNRIYYVTERGIQIEVKI